MPWDTSMPLRSSGDVSVRHSTTLSPCSAARHAASEENTIFPDAAPGPAGSPWATGSVAINAWGSKTGTSKESIDSAGTFNNAVRSSIKPSCCISTAMRTAAWPVRFPFLVCSRYNLPCSIVNSKSCMSRKCCSSFSRVRNNSSKLSGISSTISAIFLGVRTPATTSSPCASIRYSPYRTFSPVAGSRVNATPVALFSPKFPNTMA